MGTIEQYLLQLNSENRRLRRAAAVLSMISLFVVTGVFWNLRIPAIAIANSATCGQEEHQHSEECPVQTILVCEYAENEAEENAAEKVDVEEIAVQQADSGDIVEDIVTGEATLDEAEEYADENIVENKGELIPQTTVQTPAEHTHVHTDECYIVTCICEIEEHLHKMSCYADETADIETSEVWEQNLPQLTGQWNEDIVLVAQSQLGNKESEINYTVVGDDETRNGITRYGQWYGNPYGDWSAMFAMFCLNYADIPQQTVPQSPGADNMMKLVTDAGIFSTPDENVGAKGNILFLDTDGNGNADRLLISVESTEEQLTAIGGDLDNSVKEITLSNNDSAILGYVNLNTVQKTVDEEKETEDQPPTAETQQEDIEKVLSEKNIMLKAPATDLAVDYVAPDAAGAYLTETAKNQWQIVSGGYSGRGVTNKIDYGDVRIQKNVVPTDVENEFLVYLSADKKQSWNTVFNYGDYYTLPSNRDVGQVLSKPEDDDMLSAVQTGTYFNKFYMIIQIVDSNKQILSESDLILRYTNKGMKNGCVLVAIPGTDDAMVVAKVKDYTGTSPSNPVYIQLTESQVGGNTGSGFENISVVDTVLDTVTDTMGDNIEFVEVVAGDYDTIPRCVNNTLTWYPKPAAIQSEQTTGDVWQENAAQLVYKIRLKNDKSCKQHLDTTCSVEGCDHVYPTNKSAQLTYHFSNDVGKTYTADFSTPYVRGLLYDIHFIKIDQDTELPLKGAVFQLAGKDDTSFPVRTAVSGDDGKAGGVSFTNLLAGTYVLTETQAPEGYELTFGDDTRSMNIYLTYTSHPEMLQTDIYDDTHTDNLMNKNSTVDGIWKITNKNTNRDPTLPSTGGTGTPIYILCGCALVAVPFIYGFSMKRKYKRRSKK